MNRNQLIELLVKFQIPLIVLIGIIYISGTRGLYFFDSSIAFNYGWEIYNNKTWGVDFSSPLMPLVGYIVSIGYKIFGVTYISAVYINLIISVLFYYFVAALIPFSRFTKITHAFIFTYLIFGHWGIPAYNNITEALVILILLLAIKKGNCSTAAFKYVIFNSILLLLLTTNKLFSGFVWTALVCALEFLSYINNRTKASLYVTFRNSSVYIAIGLVIPSFIFGVANISNALYLGGNLHVLFQSFWSTLTPAKTIFSVPEINLIWILIYIIIFFFKNYTRLNHSHYVIAIGLIGHILMYVFSGDARSIDLAFIFLAIYVIENSDRKYIENNSTATYSLASFTLIIWICLFSLTYNYYGMRKAQNEYHEYIDRPNLGLKKIFSDGSFFNSISVNFADKEMINEIDLAIHNHPSQKIFFGPGLEMLYPATGNSQPETWPIWLHKGVSYNIAIEDSMRTSFSKENYNLLILPNSRIKMGFLDFLTSEIRQNYDLVNTGKYISVYVQHKHSGN